VALSGGGATTVLADDCDVSGVLVKLGPNETGAQFLRPTSLAGTIGSPGYPGVSALVQKQTSIGGRKGRGRLFWPCVPEGNVAVGGALTGTLQANLQSMFDDVLTDMAAADFPLMLLHSEGVPQSPYEITALSVQNQTATQRRRNRR